MVYMHVAMTKQNYFFLNLSLREKMIKVTNINMKIRPINRIEVFSKFSYAREEMFAGNDSLSIVL